MTWRAAWLEPYKGRVTPLLWAGAPLALVLGGCAGDFDRPRSVLNLDEVQPSIVSRVLYPVPEPFAGLTDDERRLRDLSYSFLLPPDGGGVVQRSLPLDATYWALINGSQPTIDCFAYARRLVAIPARSETMRYARLQDDIRNDLVRLDDFVPLVRRVADMDRKRDQSLAYVSGLQPWELAKAKERIFENGRIIARVHRALDERAACYRFTLERLVISAPSPAAAPVERALNELIKRIALARSAPAQVAAAVIAKD